MLERGGSGEPDADAPGEDDEAPPPSAGAALDGAPDAAGGGREETGGWVRLGLPAIPGGIVIAARTPEVLDRSTPSGMACQVISNK